MKAFPCSRCKKSIRTMEEMKEECPKPDPVYKKYILNKKPSDPPVGHSLTGKDYMTLLQQEAVAK